MPLEAGVVERFGRLAGLDGITGALVESPTGKRFIIRSRMLNDAELEYFGLGPTA